MSTDSKFITNENGQSLLQRFKVLINDTRFFDVLVGYFFSSGFYELAEPLKKTERIRILIGIGTNRQTLDLIQSARQQNTLAGLSPAETKDEFSKEVENELEKAPDNAEVEEGVNKFIEWLANSRSADPNKKPKLEIRAYPSAQIHSKLYIMTFKEGGRDDGRVITGSSNFTQAGLKDNLELNVELKDKPDYDFAKAKFEELWALSVDVSDKYIDTIRKKTWLNEDITPWELYLKFLYEYFRDELDVKEELRHEHVPGNFLKLEYQEQAVLNAKRILDEYGGVFISDVVGLGKTYISAMLAQQLDGRHLVIAPPALLDEKKPGSWRNVFSDFEVSAHFQSIGKLTHLLEMGTEKFRNVFIDESHRFRTETTISYEDLARICRGKRVILVSATPFNNYPKDILNQIKLFQKPRNSSIPGVVDLEKVFRELEKKTKGVDRLNDFDKYIELMRENANEVREKVLKFLMVRRTRGEIQKYFADDLKKQELSFPEILDPRAVYYEMDGEIDRIFTKSIELITKQLTYCRYKPLTYLQNPTQFERMYQENLGKIMKILLIKRLESSFHAFRETIGRFIRNYRIVIDAYDKGNVYLSKDHSSKIFELLESGDIETIEEMVENEKATKYDVNQFDKKLRDDLQNDLKVLEQIESMWSGIQRDPKLKKLQGVLTSDEILKKGKIIIFSESKDTVEYLKKHLSQEFGDVILTYHGQSPESARDEITRNFDARAPKQENRYRILIATEVLAEGINLHQSNIVINYDIPWNPTRVIQRVGRVNRVDTKHKKIYVFNFFPSVQSNNEIKLKEAAEAKIHSFIEMLGSDAKLLTEGEPVKSFELFNRLNSQKFVAGEDEDAEKSELKYYRQIRDIQLNDQTLFERIKRIPKKARTSRKFDIYKNSLLTFFRKGKLKKFYICEDRRADELNFIEAAKKLECDSQEPKETLNKAEYFEYLAINKKKFEEDTQEEVRELNIRGGRDYARTILHILKSRQLKDFKGFTDDDEQYKQKVETLIREGGLPKPTLKKLSIALKGETDPTRIIAKIKANIPSEFYGDYLATSAAQHHGPREVILSEYLAR